MSSEARNCTRFTLHLSSEYAGVYFVRHPRGDLPTLPGLRVLMDGDWPVGERVLRDVSFLIALLPVWGEMLLFMGALLSPSPSFMAHKVSQ